MGNSGRADQELEWASIHHDAQNTGNYQSPLLYKQVQQILKEMIESVAVEEIKNRRGYYCHYSVYWDGVVER